MDIITASAEKVYKAIKQHTQGLREGHNVCALILYYIHMRYIIALPHTSNCSVRCSGLRRVPNARNVLLVVPPLWKQKVELGAFISESKMYHTKVCLAQNKQ